MKTRAFLAGVVVAMLAAALVFIDRSDIRPLAPLRDVEGSLLDQRFTLRGATATQDRVALVQLDNRTLHEAPELFERRAHQARVIDAIHAAGAAVLGIDIIYTEPEQLIDAGLTAEIEAWLEQQPADDADTARSLLKRVADETHGDQALAASIKAADIVVMGFHVGDEGNVPPLDRALAKGKYGQMAGGPYLPERTGRAMASLPMFNKGAERLGLITTYTDGTGAVRRIPLGERFGPSVFAPMAVQLYAEALDINRGKVAILGTDDSVHVGEHVIPGSEGYLLLNWRGPAVFPRYSAVDVVNSDIPEGALDGRIVILGASHLGQDKVMTPFNVQPGVEVHATAVDNLLAGDWLTRTSPLVDAAATLVAGLLIALIFLPGQLSALTRSLAAITLLAATAGGLQWAFAAKALWIGAVGPLAAIVIGTAVCMAVAYGQEGIQRQYLRRTFAHYLSDDLVEELVADPKRVKLSGDRRELTVLFTDIRNFTSFSEQLSPLELAGFLAKYFEPMTRAVMHNNGYVDKFIGDAIMGIFGAPVAKGMHAIDGCRAVVEMYHALDQVRPAAQELGIELAIGAGLNTGEMVVGNMGSKARFDYTVLGDAVNLASRVEGLTKRYGVFCLVGAQTAQQAGAEAQFRSVDLVRVKGKAEPVEILELLGVGHDSIAQYAGIDVFEGALAAWRRGDFAAAREGFAMFSAANPHDGVAPLYLERLGVLGDTAPDDWDGVFTFTEK